MIGLVQPSGAVKKKKITVKRKKKTLAKRRKKKRSIIIHAAAAAVIGNRSHKPVLQIDSHAPQTADAAWVFLLKLVPSNNIRCYNLI
ncbi:hypothetical protein HUN87_12620 [Bacillus amyloliquefaciens]|nr:hypothetical protein [Bacillus amyloliquefaciens]NUI23720.1 hypothetical protein [Bacillus amyloliquefaciens]NUI32707.1 hypothetical protein [Bacillus amyloliquefaciens]NUI36413.1 hypothetical protein [Bacillus amyloliquefaciens]NUI70081.1 hypothetical protein [Bacillus amyloliquefaciens]NUI73678.1 hypothetical protein [Bacillus amyloliquefaciens]